MRSLIAAATVWLAATSAQAADLSVQLRGSEPAASAGYLMAQARGYYTDEGISVALLPQGDAHPFESLARGQADLVVAAMPLALVARENGLPLVHIGQIRARSALRLTYLREAGITTASDLRGKTIATAFSGDEYPLLAWLNRLGLRADDSLEGVTLLARWSDGPAMLRHRQADCLVTTAHDAPLPDDLAGRVVTLDPAAQGADLLEDGLYALPATLAAPQAAEHLARFLRASLRGWHEAVTHPGEAAQIVLGPDPDPGALSRQTAMIGAMSGMISDSGALDIEAYRRTVETLRLGGDDAVLRADPAPQAHSPAISDMAARSAAAAGR